ncbi:hypothetical protein [Rugosimonospora africana]|uniref:Thioesterase domain-containing protein n=1 Tax=Rugosimonospora africana TaxID=556532 RepID=A0A8J3R0M9_9ACTN|nr:hypothetical protein [Rugosimonospora africana]GIH19627.1 hypothetical protein Raf01_77990 [Rugosimonospora africana]
MNVLRWQALRAGDNARAILAVDFGEGRREAGFPELIASLPGAEACLVSQFDAGGLAALHAESGVTPQRLRRAVDGWSDSVADLDTHPVAVLSYCAGASLACLIADRLAARGARPAVVMLDPLVVVPDSLLGRFAEAVYGLTGLLSDDLVEATVAGAAAEVRADPDPSGARLSACAERLSERYAAVVYRACEEADLGDDLAQELHEHFTNVLRYQALAGSVPAHEIWSPGAARDTTVFVSREHHLVPPLPAATAMFDAGRAEFLARPELAVAVAGVVARSAAPATP